MKRKISIFLVLILCFCVWAEPVAAAETDGTYINVLDYTSIDGDNFMTFTNTASYNVVLPFRHYYNYIDIVFTWTGSEPTGISYGGTPLLIVPINSHLSRAYGSIRATSQSTVALSFSSGVDSSTSVEINSFRIFQYDYNYFDERCTCEIEAQGFTGSPISYSSSDPTNLRSWDSPDDFTLGYLELRIFMSDWEKYDFLDYTVLLSCGSVNSVKASIGDLGLPVEITYFDNDAIVVNDFLLNIRVDLRGVVKNDASLIPTVFVEANAASGQLNLVSMEGCFGVVETVTQDPYLYFLQRINYYNRNLENWILDQTEDLGVYFQSLNTNLTSEFSALQSINDAGFKKIDALKTSVDNMKTALDHRLVQIYQLIDAWGELNYKHLGDLFTDFKTSVDNRLVQIYSLIDSWAELNYEHLNDLFAALTAVIKGDAHAGDDFQQDVDGKDQELEDMAAVMDSVTRPALDQIDVSVDSYVTPADVTMLTTPLLVFFTGDLFGPIVIMTILMATVSYVLYGKR